MKYVHHDDIHYGTVILISYMDKTALNLKTLTELYLKVVFVTRWLKRYTMQHAAMTNLNDSQLKNKIIQHC